MDAKKLIKRLQNPDYDPFLEEKKETKSSEYSEHEIVIHEASKILVPQSLIKENLRFQSTIVLAKLREDRKTEYLFYPHLLAKTTGLSYTQLHNVLTYLKRKKYIQVRKLGVQPEHYLHKETMHEKCSYIKILKTFPYNPADYLDYAVYFSYAELFHKGITGRDRILLQIIRALESPRPAKLTKLMKHYRIGGSMTNYTKNLCKILPYAEATLATRIHKLTLQGYLTRRGKKRKIDYKRTKLFKKIASTVKYTREVDKIKNTLQSILAKKYPVEKEKDSVIRKIYFPDKNVKIIPVRKAKRAKTFLRRKELRVEREIDKLARARKEKTKRFGNMLKRLQVKKPVCKIDKEIMNGEVDVDLGDFYDKE